ncbi:MAG: SLC13 family permease [Rhodospirillaceae bacterium]|nr:SLC13 family permease [Rhodospirillaceae bacterium]
MSAEILNQSDNVFQMWATFALIIGALALYVSEKLSIEVTSIGVICLMIAFFQGFPVSSPDGLNTLSAERLLRGFANPALITVLALLVVGQGMVRTGVLDKVSRMVLDLGADKEWLSMSIVMAVVLIISAFLNNIPVVVIFIPIMQVLSDRFKRSTSKVMMGLSYAAVLGGMTTLIGSGTNLLVSSALLEMGEQGFGFFDFSVPGIVLAVAGLAYILFILPSQLPDRTSLAHRIMTRSPRHFMTQISVAPGSRLIGAMVVGGVINKLVDVRVRMIVRGEKVLTPPFHDELIEEGDSVTVAASRQALSDALNDDPGFLLAAANEPGGEDAMREGERVMAEVMVAPASSMIGLRLRQTGFQLRTRCFVLGIQRRSQMIRSRLADTVLAAGDVLLVQGEPGDIEALRADRNVVLMEWSTEEMAVAHHAKRAAMIFFGIVFFAATGLLPVVAAALMGAVIMVLSGALNLQQASRALDSKILTMIPAALAMGAAMQETGGAHFLAQSLMATLNGASPAVILSVFFAFTAIMANIISAKATAVLFTPIAIGVAREAGIDPQVFAIAVVFAANCAIATPIGYQTSILVMGPGHYRFGDYFRAGAPLIVLLWIVFSLFAPWYFGL